MHFQLFGDVTQYHGLHALITIIKKQSLASDNRVTNTLQGVTAALQALQEPACFLQAIAQLAGIVASTGVFQVILVNRIYPQIG